MPLQEVESRKNKPLLRARRLFCPPTFDFRLSTFDFRLSDLRRPSSQFQHFILSAWRPWRLSGSNPENWKTWKQIKGNLNINDPDAWNQWLKCRFLGLIVAGAGGHELRRPLTT
jgi:hypothetical protein